MTFSFFYKSKIVDSPDEEEIPEAEPEIDSLTTPALEKWLKENLKDDYELGGAVGLGKESTASIENFDEEQTGKKTRVRWADIESRIGVMLKTRFETAESENGNRRESTGTN